MGARCSSSAADTRLEAKRPAAPGHREPRGSGSRMDCPTDAVWCSRGAATEPLPGSEDFDVARARSESLTSNSCRLATRRPHSASPRRAALVYSAQSRDVELFEFRCRARQRRIALCRAFLNVRRTHAPLFTGWSAAGLRIYPVRRRRDLDRKQRRDECAADDLDGRTAVLEPAVVARRTDDRLQLAPGGHGRPLSPSARHRRSPSDHRRSGR